MFAAVVGRWENCDKLSFGKSLESIHDTLVGPNDHVQVVLFEETLNSVWSKLDDIACLWGIS